MRPRFLAGLACVLVVCTMGYADTLQFSGTSEGCFGASCTPTSSQSTFDTHFFFNPLTTTTNFGTAITMPVPPNNGTVNVSDFGSFTLNNGTQTYTDGEFTLEILFTAPPTITGGQNQTFGADINGYVHGGTVNTPLTIVWDNNGIINNLPFTFTTSGTEYAGNFSIDLNDLTFSQTGSQDITGTITVNAVSPVPPVPEPASLALFGSGLFGLAGLARRRFVK